MSKFITVLLLSGLLAACGSSISNPEIGHSSHGPEVVNEEVIRVENGLYENCSIAVYRNERYLDSDTLVNLIWSYMEVDEIREYGVSTLRLDLERAIGSLQQSNHLVKNIYPVSYAQKI